MVRLRDGLAVLWREAGASQIGTDPRCAVVLENLSEPEQTLLDRLRSEPSLGELVREGRAAGIGAAQVRALVATLERAGVLAPDTTPRAPFPNGPEQGNALDAIRAPDIAYWARLRPDANGWAVLAGRRSRTVAVLGVDRLGMLVASGLARAGVGTVLLADPAPVRPLDVGPGAFAWDDVGRRREDAGAEGLRATAPRLRTSAPPGTRPDVAVLVEHGVASPVRARPLVREDLAHLSVVVGDVSVGVGPLVVPGVGPCLRCLDLHRCDADERWPAVATQIAAAPGEGVEASLAPLAAALAVGQVLAHLDGRAVSARGATLEVDAVEPVPRRRTWTPHPECGCGGVEAGPGAGLVDRVRPGDADGDGVGSEAARTPREVEGSRR